jgi:tryptophan-rich sensory protein
MIESLAFLGKPVGVATVAACFVALAGALLTEIGPWYRALKKPAWQPPDWAFGPAWTIIFALAATAGVLGWERAPDATGRLWMLWLFGANAALNILWSVLYFRFKRPDWAFIEVFALWASVLLLIVAVWPYSRLSAWLLVPYLLWVTFAGALNLATARLNAPFGHKKNPPG